MFQTQGFHPGRREHAEEFISKLADPKSRKYATALLSYIWQCKGKPPQRRGISVLRAKEIDAALYAVFATIR